MSNQNNGITNYCQMCEGYAKRLTEVEAQRNELLDEIETLHCDLASAFGWKPEIEGTSWPDAVRTLIGERDRLRNAAECAVATLRTALASGMRKSGEGEV